MADFRAKKALGQNFINDPQIIEAIVDACGAGPDDTVVEIGPGKGALTCTLAERAARVIAVELDSSVIPLLKGNLAGASNVEVVNEDILKFDWSRVVGNSFATEKQFSLTAEEMDRILEPSLYIGRCPQQVTALLEKVRPLIENVDASSAKIEV